MAGLGSGIGGPSMGQRASHLDRLLDADREAAANRTTDPPSSAVPPADPEEGALSLEELLAGIERTPAAPLEKLPEMPPPAVVVPVTPPDPEPPFPTPQATPAETPEEPTVATDTKTAPAEIETVARTAGDTALVEGFPAILVQRIDDEDTPNKAGETWTVGQFHPDGYRTLRHEFTEES